MLATTRRYARQLLGRLEIHHGRQLLLFLGCLGLALGVFFLAGRAEGLSLAARRTLFIVVLAGCLWMTEAIPSFAVSIFVIALSVALLGAPGGVFAKREGDWEQFVEVLGHPLIWLFFGGFVLAAAAAKAGLDRHLARRMLRLSGSKPAGILAGVMGLTFLLSMFMSNTATTAMMLGVLTPLVYALREDDPFREGLLLGLCSAANLGGMASLIGTPPNAIAVGLLAERGAANISFLKWLMLGGPPAVVLAFLAYGWLLRRFPSAEQELPLTRLGLDSPSGTIALMRWQRWTVVGVFAATVGLWMTSSLHGLPTTTVSLLPLVVFTATGVISAEDVRGLAWDVLLLIAGGLALGSSMSVTGLADWLVAALPLDGLAPNVLAFVLAYFCLMLSNFMSNTAAANILVPLAIALVPGQAALLAVPLALAASAASALPISTPPNAIAFSRGIIKAKNMLHLGLLLGLVAPAMATLWAALLL